MDVEWPLLVKKVLPLVLYRVGVMWKFVCGKPFGDGLYALLLVYGFGLVKGGFCTAHGDGSEHRCGSVSEMCQVGSDVAICLYEIWLLL